MHIHIGRGEHEEGEPDATCHLKRIWIVSTGITG